jgi:Lipocalin-like domain
MARRSAYRRYWVVLVVGILGAAILSAAIAVSGADRAESASLRDRGGIKHKFIGTWRLESEFLQDESGAVVGSLYDDAIGKLTYTRRGDVWALTGERERSRTEGAVWYTGTFDVRRRAHTVIHHIEYSSIPSWEGGDQVRRFDFDGKQRLTLSLDASATVTAVLEWRKVRRR